MSSQSSTMIFLDDIISHRDFGNAQLTSFEQLTILDYEIQPLCPIKCKRFYTSVPSFTKIEILWIQIHEFLEPNYFNLHFYQQKMSSTECIYNSIRLPTFLLQKKMCNSAKTQPTSNAFGLIYLDYSNIAKLDDQCTKQTL